MGQPILWKVALALAGITVLTACTEVRGDISRDGATFDGIAPDATVTALGTEPFWSLTITPNATGAYEGGFSTLETPDPQAFALTRFAGNNGIGYSGTLEGEAVQLALTPGECSDQMSDRRYPFTATMAIGEATLMGCAYTSADPFAGEVVP
ncbi:MAG: hypothetical protein V2J51_14745 [Erythrobacter sp.]|jgi:uncharacterized membrane protein|nr:hypothetical protein [Erythrobacter sp.]